MSLLSTLPTAKIIDRVRIDIWPKYWVVNLYDKHDALDYTHSEPVSGKFDAPCSHIAAMLREQHFRNKPLNIVKRLVKLHIEKDRRYV